MPGRSLHRLGDRVGARLRRGAHDHADVRRRRPAERGGSRAHSVVDLAAQQGVDDERLDAGVPGAARLGGLGVDLRRCEGDLAAVEQDRLAQHRLLAGEGDLVDVLLHDVDREAYEVDRATQADGAYELARGRTEHVGGDGQALVGVLEPLHEAGDARLGDQADPGSVLGRQAAIPGELLVHALDRGRGEGAHGALEPSYGRCAALVHTPDRTGDRRRVGCGTPTSPSRYGGVMEGSTAGRARRGVRVLLVVFWLLVLIGGAVNPGYSHLHDHVSDLASYGARAAWIGGLAIATFGVADAGRRAGRRGADPGGGGGAGRWRARPGW